MPLRVKKVGEKWRVVGSETGRVERIARGSRGGQPVDGGGYATKAEALRKLEALERSRRPPRDTHPAKSAPGPLPKRLARQRRRLEAMLAHLRRRTAAVERDLRREDVPLEAGFEEQAIQVENDEVLERLLDQGANQIPLVEGALARIEAGTFGACVDCRARIPLERLEALPYAAACLACARRRELEA